VERDRTLEAGDTVDTSTCIDSGVEDYNKGGSIRKGSPLRLCGLRW
jgi:hypothetical protein